MVVPVLIVELVQDCSTSLFFFVSPISDHRALLTGGVGTSLCAKLEIVGKGYSVVAGGGHVSVSVGVANQVYGIPARNPAQSQ